MWSDHIAYRTCLYDGLLKRLCGLVRWNLTVFQHCDGRFILPLCWLNITLLDNLWHRLIWKYKQPYSHLHHEQTVNVACQNQLYRPRIPSNKWAGHCSGNHQQNPDVRPVRSIPLQFAEFDLYVSTLCLFLRRCRVTLTARSYSIKQVKMQYDHFKSRLTVSYKWLKTTAWPLPKHLSCDVFAAHGLGFWTDRSAVHEAAARGQVMQLQKLIHNGASVNIVAMDSITPLHEACIQGHSQCVRLLLDAGAHVSLQIHLWQ